MKNTDYLKGRARWLAGWAWQSFKWWCVWALPIFLLDACLNRDPYFRIDSHFSLAAISPGDPLFLQYNNYILQDNETPEDYESNHWEIETRNDPAISELAIIGSTPNESGFRSLFDTKRHIRYFIADRKTGKAAYFTSEAERDQRLWTGYRLARSQFSPPGWLMAARSNPLWPWNDLYYAGALLGALWVAYGRCRRQPVPA